MKETSKYLSPELIVDEVIRTNVICTSCSVDGIPTILGGDVTDASDQFSI